jgi:hypothetical protein
MKKQFSILKTKFFIHIGLVILFCFLNSCSHETEDQKNITMSYTKDHDYKFNWNANPEPDMDHYLVYGWHGPDTTKTPFKDGADIRNLDGLLIQQVPHQFNTPIIRDTIMYTANGDWLHFAIAAVNKSKEVSKIGISNFLKSDIANREKGNPGDNSGQKGQSDLGVSY